MSMLNKFFVAIMLIVLVFAPQVFAQTKIPCTCRFQGVDFGLGEEICMKRPAGSTLARCEMVLNNTSWKFTEAPCPVTELQPTVTISESMTTQKKSEKFKVSENIPHYSY